MSTGSALINLIASRQNLDDYQKKHWVGSFAEYLDIIRREPQVTRTAYQRIYDMIISHGTEEVVVNKEKLVRYKFFEDPENHGQDAIFGLERTLMNFRTFSRAAANGYGTEPPRLAFAWPGCSPEEQRRCAPAQERARTFLAGG